MSTHELKQGLRSSSNQHRMIVKIFGTAAVLLLAVIVVVWGYLFTRTGVGALFLGLLKWLFVTNSVQLWWYVTRSAGLIGYFLLWLSTAWGLAVSSKIFDPLLHRAYTYDFHQFLSLLAIGFVLLHIIVLLLDRYLPFTVTQVLVPFTAPYRPVWVGLGVIGFYLTLLVTVTFYIRRTIGMQAFRWIHTLSLVSYAGATLHGFFAGTDSALLPMRVIYEASGLTIVFLTSYWLINQALSKKRGTKRVSA